MISSVLFPIQILTISCISCLAVGSIIKLGAGNLSALASLIKFSYGTGMIDTSVGVTAGVTFGTLITISTYKSGAYEYEMDVSIVKPKVQDFLAHRLTTS
jgi:hypothetical protein